MERLKINTNIKPFIKEIFLLKQAENNSCELPFYADGYPGIMYSETSAPIILQPIKKELPNFFLYGQTIKPISLAIKGPYKIIVFQLYPFATRLLLGINPKEINDQCYDLKEVQNMDTSSTISSLITSKTDGQVKIIADYILDLIKNAITDSDNAIKLAVSTIINVKGLIQIKDLRRQLYITERTFERRFTKEVGVSPKQFAKIIQFSFSLNNIQESDYTNFTSIAYENGFADQSHFIRTFKKYTGKTPKEMLKKLA